MTARAIHDVANIRGAMAFQDAPAERLNELADPGRDQVRGRLCFAHSAYILFNFQTARREVRHRLWEKHNE